MARGGYCKAGVFLAGFYVYGYGTPYGVRLVEFYNFVVGLFGNVE